MSDPRTMSGVWYGRYVSSSDEQDNGFIAVLEESGGVFTGTISERDDIRAGTIRRAGVAGRRDGSRIGFVKQYLGPHLRHAVVYAGTIDEEGTAASGNWQVDWLSGSFTMNREKFTEEQLSADEEEVIEIAGY